jgi:hypothetical protein
MSGHSMRMLEEFLQQKKKTAEELMSKTSQKDYFRGQVEMIDELLSDMKKKPIPFNPWLMPF